MPGVVVTTSAVSGTGTALIDNSGQFFVAGLAERGVTDKAVLIRGIADFETEFGGRTTYSSLYDSVRLFFDEGGEQAYVSRVVGAAPVKATIIAQDTAVAPVNTIAFDASSEGEWGNNIIVTVAEGTAPSTVKVTVTLDGGLKESYDNLATPTAIVNALSTSAYVRARNLGSVSVAPTNLPALDTYELASGTDDRASIDVTSYKAALDRFVIGYGSGAVAIPAVGTLVHGLLVEHATANRRIALLSTDEDATITAITSLAASHDTQYAGLFAPWVNVSDGYGGARAVSPEGYVAGARARAHTQYGAERIPAGAPSVARSIVSLAVNYTVDESAQLDNGKVSVIRNINNTNRLYGWRSLSNDLINWRFLNGADLMNYLTVICERELEQYVYAMVDAKGQLTSAIHGTLTGIIEPIAIRGGLYPLHDDAGEEIDPGYLVETGSSVNSLANLKNNEVHARLGFRLAPSGETISLTIVKASQTTGF